MAEQLFKEGDTFKHGKVTLECVVVNFRPRDGKKENFVYGFREQAEVEKERKDAENPEPINNEEEK